MTVPLLICVVLLAVFAGFFFLQARTEVFTPVRTWAAVFLLVLGVFPLALLLHDTMNRGGLPGLVGASPVSIACDLFSLLAAGFSLHGLFRLLSAEAASTSQRTWSAIVVIIGILACLAFSGRLAWGSALGLGLMGGSLALAEALRAGKGE